MTQKLSHAQTFRRVMYSLNLIKRFLQSTVREFARPHAKTLEMGQSLDTIREMAFGKSAHAREKFLKAWRNQCPIG